MIRKLEETEGDFYDMRLGFRKSSGNLLPDLIGNNLSIATSGIPE